jgi:hypothetical protein
VATERTILWRIDGERVLREFARKCALDVIHLWDAPEVVKKYLETGDWRLRSAAKAASAAWAADAAKAASAAWAASAASTESAVRAARAVRAVDAARAAQNKLLTEMVEKYHEKNA